MQQQHPDSKNTIIFIVAAMLMLGVYQFLIIAPAQREAEAQQRQIAAAQPKAAPGAPAMPGAAAPSVYISRPDALAAGPRVKIDTPAMTGSISLRGARLDDLYLTGYRETLDANSPPVELFRPKGVQFAYFAQNGWVGQNLPGLPTDDTVWTQTGGGTLAPNAPVTLTYNNGQGLVFTRNIAVDDQFLFTITDTVANLSAAPVTLAPYASIQRHGLADPKGAQGVHEGAVGVMGPLEKPVLELMKFRNWKKKGDQTFETTGGWLGLSDKYWLAALIPDQKQAFDGTYRVTQAGETDIFETALVGDQGVIIQPGRQITQTLRLFTGAKVVPVLRTYGEQLGAPRFLDAVDWGWGYFVTKPVFWAIELFYGWVGNFGIAILMMTVLVKLLFFYPANLSYESMTKMRKVQPQLEKLKEQHKNDPGALQQGMMALYRDEKINPLMGCLPMLATIPVFLALFHVLNVTIEMRHAPFYGWIQDLSARDPTTIWNLFGLIPWNPAQTPVIGGFFDGFLHLGAWPLLYGLTMWLTTAMSPPAPDPIQQKIMMWMPFIFTFILAQFAAGLLIYYTWSNILTIIQQYIIMRRFKVDNPIDQIIRKVTGKPEPAV
jgi:YidC/Oxa1 family membrane protein insertase